MGTCLAFVSVAKTMGTRVLLADDHAVVRSGVKLLLELEGFEVVGQAADGLEAVRLARDLKPEIAVLDRSMPLLNGVEAAKEIKLASPDTRLILLTMDTNENHLLEALRAGFNGCVLKSYEARELIVAIRTVMNGGSYLHPELSKTLVEAYTSRTNPRPDVLSHRERQVLQLLAEGKRTRDVAELLSLGVKTAESHRTRIMKKLGIKETAGLVRYALREGVTQL